MLKELTNLRTSRSKTFQKKVGRRVVIDKEPLHYFDGQAYRDIDLSFDSNGNCLTSPIQFKWVGPDLRFEVIQNGVASLVYLESVDEKPFNGNVVINSTGDRLWLDLGIPNARFWIKMLLTGPRFMREYQNKETPKEWTWIIDGSLAVENRGRDNVLGLEHREGDRDQKRSLDVHIATEEIEEHKIRVREWWTGKAVTRDPKTRVPSLTDEIVYPIFWDPQFTQQIADGANDGYANDTTWYGSGASITVGAGTDGGWRFTNVTVPKNAVIASATITFEVNTVYGAATKRFQAHDADNSSAFDSDNVPADRTPLTTAYNDWLPAGTGTRAMDVAAIVQELVDRAGWASGNAMSFMGWRGAAGVWLTFKDFYLGAPNNGATLTIDYSEDESSNSSSSPSSVSSQSGESTSSSKSASSQSSQSASSQSSLSSSSLSSSSAIWIPIPPETFTTWYERPTGETLYVHAAGGNNTAPHYSSSDALQRAINDAASHDLAGGTRIVVDADYVWDDAVEGTSLRLRTKTGTGWIYIESASLGSMPEKLRIDAADATYMPKLKTDPDDLNVPPALSAISTDAPSAAHHYRFCGIEFIDPENTESGTDLVVDGTNNLKVTSATYNFVAGDVSKYIGIPATIGGWTAGAYQISSVAGNAAFLSSSPAAIGTTGGVWSRGIFNQYNIINLNSTITVANGGETGTWYLKTDGVLGNDRMPSYIWFDRCYIHSDRDYPFRCPTGIQFDGEYMAIFESRIENIRGYELGDALNFKEGNGPYHIRNNYLDSSVSNIMMGAGDPTYGYLDGNLPQDIEVVGNYFTKNTTRYGDFWYFYNHIEIKNGQRVLIEGNYFEKVTRSDQGHGGLCIELSVRSVNNQASGHTAPWSRTTDILIQNNKCRSVGSFFSVVGCDPNATVYGSDLVADASHTTNKRVSSATHTFVAGDVNMVIEIDSSVDWDFTYAKIVSVNASPNYAVLDKVAGVDNGTGGVFRSCQRTQRVRVRNNVAEDISSSYAGGTPSGLFGFTTSNGVSLNYITFDHNLLVVTGVSYTAGFINDSVTGEETENLIMTNNIMPFGRYGFFRDGGLYAKAALDENSTNYTWNKNAYYTRAAIDPDYDLFIDPTGNTGTFDPGTPWAARAAGGNSGAAVYTNGSTWSNWGPEELAGVGFTYFETEGSDLDTRDYSLTPSSPYYLAGTDGTDLGPDWAELNAAIDHAIDGDLTGEGSSVSSSLSSQSGESSLSSLSSLSGESSLSSLSSSKSASSQSGESSQSSSSSQSLSSLSSSSSSSVSSFSSSSSSSQSGEDQGGFVGISGNQRDYGVDGENQMTYSGVSENQRNYGGVTDNQRCN